VVPQLAPAWTGSVLHRQDTRTRATLAPLVRLPQRRLHHRQARRCRLCLQQ
jgi:hypothetical protein